MSDDYFLPSFVLSVYQHRRVLESFMLHVTQLS